MLCYLSLAIAHYLGATPHVYAHCGDLRQFPVVGFRSLLLILAAKQRIENIRRLRLEHKSALQLNSLDELETALQHIIFDNLTTTTLKVDSQKNVLQQVHEAAAKNSAHALRKATETTAERNPLALQIKRRRLDGIILPAAAPPATARDRTDFTELHLAVLQSLDCVIVECGGDGDCFYHCALWLAQTFCPIPQWSDHLQLRVEVVDHFKQNWEQIYLSRDVPICATLEGRSQSKDARPSKMIEGFAKQWVKKGEYVENEVIAAFAHFVGYPVVVHNIWEEHIHVLLPAALQEQCDIPPSLMNHTEHENDDIRSTPFVLWCTGNHYQAVVPKQNVRIATKALTSFRYKNSNVIGSKDVSVRKR